MNIPECPVCGEKCNDFYVSQYGREIVGCEHCISLDSAWERTEEDKLDEEINIGMSLKGWDTTGWNA